MFKMKAIAVALTTAVLASGSANAATILLDNISAQWVGYTGGNGTVTSSTAGNSATLAWGTPSSGAQSQFAFTGYDPITFNDPHGPANAKALGSLEHTNATIEPGTSISQAVLQISADVVIGGVSAGSQNFLFTIFHDETPNESWLNLIIPNYCCDDNVSFDPVASSTQFNFGGTDYTMFLSGFQEKHKVSASFSTGEGGTNKANLMGYVTAVPGAVPEPSTWAMMIGGLGFVGGMMRRRKTAVSFA